MAQSEPNREDYCLERAAEARAKADGMKDREAKRTMLEVAQMWDAMAKRAARSRQPSN